MNWFNIAITGAAGFWSVLAQLPMPGGSEFLAVVGALIVIATLVRLYYDIMAGRRKANESDEPKRRLLPDPLGVRHVYDFVNQPQFEKHQADVDRRIEKIYGMIERTSKDTHDRINDVLKEVSALRGSFDTSQRRQHPDDR